MNDELSIIHHSSFIIHPFAFPPALPRRPQSAGVCRGTLSTIHYPLSTNSVRCSLLAFLPRVGLVVADNLLIHGVPSELPFQPNGEVGQVTGRDRAVLDLHRSTRLLAGLHAIEEVGHVVGARIRVPGIGRQRVLLELIGRLAAHAAAVDEHSTFLADKHDAVAIVLLDLRGDILAEEPLDLFGRRVLVRPTLPKRARSLIDEKYSTSMPFAYNMREKKRSGVGG